MDIIFIFGFMGAGKTTFGRKLATNLKLPFYDLDAEIVQKTSLSIATLFQQKGEADFREIESQIFTRWNQPGVLATGGGVLSLEKNRTYAKQSNSFNIFLHTNFSIIYERIRYSPRPLVQQLSRKKLFHLWQQRIPQYKECSQMMLINFSE